MVHVQQRRGVSQPSFEGTSSQNRARLEQRAPVDVFLHSYGSAAAQVDVLELDMSCARRMRATRKGPVSCHCVVCAHTA